MTQEKKRKRLRKLWEENPNCHWCGEPTFLIEYPPVDNFKIGPQHPKMATIDHLHSRYDSERGKHKGEIQTVLACHACNDKRNEKEQAAVPKEELTRRGKAFNRKRRRRKKRWERRPQTDIDGQLNIFDPPEDFHKKVRFLHFLINQAVKCIRDRAYQPPHWDREPTPEMLAAEEEIQKECDEADKNLQELAAKIYLGLTGKKL